MNTINTLESQLTNREQKNSNSVVRAYIATRESGNEHLDFTDGIMDHDLPDLTAELDALGIQTFTISCDQTGMARTLQELSNQGWTLAGITNVKERFADITTGERKERPAFKLDRN